MNFKYFNVWWLRSTNSTTFTNVLASNLPT